MFTASVIRLNKAATVDRSIAVCETETTTCIDVRPLWMCDKHCVRQSQRDNVLFIPHMIYGIISFHLLHTRKFMARIDVFKHFLFMAFLSSHTLCEARAHTHTHTTTIHFSTTLLRRRLHRHTITQFSFVQSRFVLAFLYRCFLFSSHPFIGESICTRFAASLCGHRALVWVLRVFIHSNQKNIVIAYRPAKASSSHNNLTATEWTAHTIFSFFFEENLNARATTIARRTTNTFLLCAHTTTTTTITITTTTNANEFLCKYFSISSVDHNVWLLFRSGKKKKQRLILTLTQNTEDVEKRKNRTILVYRLNGGVHCAAVWRSKTESIVKTYNSIKYYSCTACATLRTHNRSLARSLASSLHPKRSKCRPPEYRVYIYV